MTKNLVNPDRSTDFDAKRANHLVNSWPGAKDWCEWDGEQWPCEWVQLYDELVRLREAKANHFEAIAELDLRRAVLQDECERLREENAKLRDVLEDYHARGGPQ